ncbi:AraC family transcriptional regulator [Zunongwangia profunda]|uniref:AraC family transcriptional regulator n=1 Tax=Zunongwangia profunda TaxID=398743 RepID=UPI001D19677E|nr:helix-turn-helix domain-containing protein [Zunongwangia profunda]MCC4230103.1 helix-turn-helix domain-containing protein [Zunongwangia profunda]
MDITYNFISFIESLGVIQGLLLGLMLILVRTRRKRATHYLGLFIVLFSLEPVTNILGDLNILKSYPQLELLPFGFHFLAYPLFYIYIQKVSILEHRKTSYWTLIPGILEVLIGLIVFFMPVKTKMILVNSIWEKIYFSAGLAYTFFICMLTLNWVRMHRRELENQYSLLIHKNLDWVLWFVCGSIFFHLFLLEYYFFGNEILYLFTAIANVVLIYWISYQGLMQQNINSLQEEMNGLMVESRKDEVIENQGMIVETGIQEDFKKKQDLVSEEEVGNMLSVIHEYIEASKCFTKQDLTIIDLADAVNIHPKRISYAINKALDINFNNYINNFRVEYAKELFQSDKARNLSVEGIGMEAGFHSKSTFYTSFNKLEGTTPAKYRSFGS